MVGCLKSDGSSFQTQNGRLGGIKNAHAYKYTDEWAGSPWNQIDEHLFQSVDDNFPRIVQELLSGCSLDKINDDDGWRAFEPSDWLQNNLAQALVSLCMRSPRTRYLASMLGRELTGFQRGSKTDLNVSLSNAIAGFKANSRSLRGKGKVGILRAINSEFIYGDGFYHNLRASGDVGTHARMLVPLTPEIAILYYKPTSYITEPMFSEIKLEKEFVDKLNDLVQVHSERFLFYRSLPPDIHPAFKLDEFKTVTQQSNPAIKLMESLPGVHS